MSTQPFFIDYKTIEYTIRNFNTRALANLNPGDFNRLPTGTVVLRWDPKGDIDTIIQKERYCDLFLTLQEPQTQSGVFRNTAYRMKTFTKIGFVATDFGFFSIDPGMAIEGTQEKQNMFLLLEGGTRDMLQLEFTDSEGNILGGITLGHKKITIGGKTYKYAVMPHIGVSYALHSPAGHCKTAKICFVEGIAIY